MDAIHHASEIALAARVNALQYAKVVAEQDAQVDAAIVVQAVV